MSTDGDGAVVFETNTANAAFPWTLSEPRTARLGTQTEDWPDRTITRSDFDQPVPERQATWHRGGTTPAADSVRRGSQQDAVGPRLWLCGHTGDRLRTTGRARVLGKASRGLNDFCTPRQAVPAKSRTGPTAPVDHLVLTGPRVWWPLAEASHLAASTDLPRWDRHMRKSAFMTRGEKARHRKWPACADKVLIDRGRRRPASTRRVPRCLAPSPKAANTRQNPTENRGPGPASQATARVRAVW